MIDNKNLIRNRGSLAPRLFLGTILAVIAAVGWYLYLAERDTSQTLDQENLALISELERLQDDNQALKKQNQSTIESAAIDKNKVGELVLAAERLKQEKSALQTELTEQQESARQHRDSLTAGQQELARLQSDLERVTQERMQLEISLQQEVTRLTSNSAVLEKELQQRQAQQDSLTQKVSAAGAEKQQLANQLNQAQARRKQLLDQIASVSNDVKTKENALSGAQQDVQQLSQELEQTRQEQGQLKARITQLSEQQEKENQHFAQLQQRLESELNESRVEIIQLKNRMTIINLTSEVLFGSGSAKIKPAGRKVLALIASSLNAYPKRAISIEGHTDNVPIGKRSFYKSNWELSSARALAAVEFLRQDDQVSQNRLRLVGYGEFQPVADNDSAEGRQLNRRIEIRLLPGQGG